MEQRLYRSRTDRMIWGVCGGLGQYLGVDPVIIRLITVLLAFASGFGILAYFILAIVMPLKPEEAAGVETRTTTEVGPRPNTIIWIILIVVAIIFLAGVSNLFWWSWWAPIWPVAILLIVLLILVAAKRR